MGVPIPKNWQKKDAKWFIKHAMPNELCLSFVAVDEHKDNPKEKCGCVYCANFKRKQGQS